MATAAEHILTDRCQFFDPSYFGHRVRWYPPGHHYPSETWGILEYESAYDGSESAVYRRAVLFTSASGFTAETGGGQIIYVSDDPDAIADGAEWRVDRQLSLMDGVYELLLSRDNLPRMARR